MSNTPLKFDLGGLGRGGDRRTVNIHEDADVQHDFLDFDAYCDDGTVEEFYLSHALEHIPSPRYRQFLLDMKRKLRPGGTVRVVQSDIKRCLELYHQGALSFLALRTVIFPPADRLRQNPYHQHFNMWGAEELAGDFRAAGYVSAELFDAGSWPMDMTDELHPGAVEQYHGVAIPNLGVVATGTPRSEPDVAPVETLRSYERKVFSQNGEDGITLRLLDLIGCHEGFYLEIGTESGAECNTRILRGRPGFTGLLLDGKFEDPAIHLHREHVTAENIAGICDRYSVPREVALLSIDIDGNDYWIWKALAPRLTAALVIIEYNAALGPSEHRVMPYDPDFRWDGTDGYGASISALTALGNELGYTLVYAECRGVNLFFVNQSILQRQGLVFRNQNAPSQLYRPPRHGRDGCGHPPTAERVPPVDEKFQIPRIIHQTWKSADIPPAFSAQWIASWRELNPGWEYRFWTDADIDSFVRSEFPEFYAVFQSYDVNIKRVDAFRYLLMKRIGGVYADLDFMCLKPLEGLLRGHYLLLGSQHPGDWMQSEGDVCNAFMASVPEHPFWEGVTLDLADHVSLDVLYATGPNFLTGRIKRGRAFLDSGLLPVVADHSLLYPFAWDTEGNEEARQLSRGELSARYPNAYAVTFWTASWK
jgi:Glycosyltransferase sugar-binding region containing DXD motif